MVKKNCKLLMLIMAFMLLSSVNVFAEPTDVELEVEYIDPDQDGSSSHRGIIFIPMLGLNNYTLVFYTPCDNYILRLLNEDNEVEFFTSIPSGTHTMVLPSYLSGEYRIEIIRPVRLKK